MPLEQFRVLNMKYTCSDASVNKITKIFTRRYTKWSWDAQLKSVKGKLAKTH